MHPGFINTPMMVEATNEDGGDAMALIPLGCPAGPKAVLPLVLFLASAKSSYSTSTKHIIDASMTAQSAQRPRCLG